MGDGRDPQVWTERERALWQTCAWVAAAATGREVKPLQPVATSFAPQGGPHDVLLCGGPYERLTFRPLGDGTYQHQGGFFFATGGLGLALTAGALVARGVGNRSRRETAAQAAVPRWVVEESGQLVVGTGGFHLVLPTAIYYWNWGSVTSMTVAGPACVDMFGDSTSGPVSWRFLTPWAELVFALWALARHPSHPQLVTGEWLPPGFLQWVAEQGYEPPLPGPAVWIEGTGPADH